MMGRQTGLGESEQTITDLLDIVMSSHRNGHEALLQMASDSISAAPECEEVVNGPWSVEEAERFHAADAMKKYFDFMVDDLDNITLRDAVVVTLVQSALSDVDWNELADSYIRRVREGGAA